MGLLETKVKKENEAKIFELSFKRWKFLTNSQSDCRARIWVCWDPDFCDVVCINMTNQLIFCKVTILQEDIVFCCVCLC